ncbi:response regulator [Ancylobacter sp. A5.8]|uniref:response regulator n=1 Tax=Ancylobacter gelatini TaxID=2919920 RepID=UPI001F4E6B64|nr:response regulator [Ancylobacter gelatini]MCJ8143775.1 response regulator [Ancylobacter gelatini]
MTIPNPLNGARIFIVEDESLVALMIEAMVEELGGQVIGSARRIDEALDFVGSSHEQIDIALLDINLGGMHSYEIAQAVTGWGIPLVFSTGYNDGSIIEEWRSQPLLSKPFQLAELQAALGNAIASRTSASRTSAA